MKKKTIYRIAIYPNDNTICDTLAKLACRFNGGANKVTLQQLKTVAESEMILYPSTSEGCKTEMIDNTLLHIERKIGEVTHTIMSIEEIEVLEMDMPEMTKEIARDILEDAKRESPTLSRTGINDTGDFEALN